MQIKQSINYSEMLEQSILGIAILEPATALKIVQLCHEDWFYFEFHKEVFKAIKKRISEFKKVDMMLIPFDLIEKYNSLTYPPINGDRISYLVAKLTEYVVSGAHISEWCSKIESLYHARQIEGISSISNSNLSSEEKKAKIECILQFSKVVKNKTNWVQMGKAIDDYEKFYSDNVGKQIVGYEIGLPKLDWLTGGFRNETLWIIGARPSIGKSALGQQIIVNCAQKGLKVGIVSIEMGNNELLSRIVSYTSGINFNDIYRLKVPLDAMHRELVKLESLKIYFSEDTKCSIEGIRASIIQLVGENALDIVVIDYLQLMHVEEKTNTKNDEMTKITTGLKELTRRLKIPIIALAQLNRAGADEPKLENLRDSGSIEQDADGVIFLHGDREGSDRKAIVAKNRNGKLGNVALKFIGEQMKFEETEVYVPINNDTF